MKISNRPRVAQNRRSPSTSAFANAKTATVIDCVKSDEPHGPSNEPEPIPSPCPLPRGRGFYSAPYLPKGRPCTYPIGGHDCDLWMRVTDYFGRVVMSPNVFDGNRCAQGTL